MRTNIIFFGLIGLILFYSRHQLVGMFSEKKVPDTVFQEAGCHGKKMCGLVYLAPWCPACNSVIPQLQIFLKNGQQHKEAGLQIVVGAEQMPGDNARKAKEIGEGVITDENNIYAGSLAISYYPSFFVIDEQKRIIHKDQDAMNWMNENFAN